METAIDTFFGLFAEPRQALAYLLLFCIPLCCPGWRSLGAVAATFGTLSLWSLCEIDREMHDPEVNAGLGAVLVAFVLWLLAAGLWSGLATRALLLALRGRMSRLPAKFAIAATGFLLWPLYISAMEAREEWDRRPPDAACLDGVHRIEVQGAVFHLPAAPFFSVWEPGERIHLFALNRTLREFCERSLETAGPLHAVLLTIAAPATLHPQDPLYLGFCAAPSSRWGRLFCGLGYPRPAEYLEEALAYNTAEFSDRHMLGGETNSYERLWEWRDQMFREGRAIEGRAVGRFMRYEVQGGDGRESYWVAADGVWKSPQGNPFAMRCSQIPPPQGSVACRATYRLASGPQLTYGFRAPQDDLESAAARIDRQVRDMLVDLAAPPGLK